MQAILKFKEEMGVVAKFWNIFHNRQIAINFLFT